MSNPNWVLGLDFETTGLNIANDEDVITEIGAVLWDWPNAKPVAMLSETVQITAGRVLDDEIVALTGITQEMVEAPLAVPEAQALDRLLQLAGLAGHLMAHNATFDRGVLEAACARNFLDVPATPWIDTLGDVPYPPTITSRKLGHVAADHGFLNPFAHRAVFDVLTMLKVATQYPLAELVAIASSPSLMLIGRFERENNDRAKRCGFRWNPETREWYRLVKQGQFERVKKLIDVGYVVTTL